MKWLEQKMKRQQKKETAKGQGFAGVTRVGIYEDVLLGCTVRIWDLTREQKKTGLCAAKR